MTNTKNIIARSKARLIPFLRASGRGRALIHDRVKGSATNTDNAPLVEHAQHIVPGEPLGPSNLEFFGTNNTIESRAPGVSLTSGSASVRQINPPGESQDHPACQQPSVLPFPSANTSSDTARSPQTRHGIRIVITDTTAPADPFDELTEALQEFAPTSTPRKGKVGGEETTRSRRHVSATSSDVYHSIGEEYMIRPDSREWAVQLQEQLSRMLSVPEHQQERNLHAPISSSPPLHAAAGANAAATTPDLETHARNQDPNRDLDHLAAQMSLNREGLSEQAETALLAAVSRLTKTNKTLLARLDHMADENKTLKRDADVHLWRIELLEEELRQTWQLVRGYMVAGRSR